jgi:hypothetical protein
MQPANPSTQQPANPAFNSSTQRVPEIGNPTPAIGGPQYQNSVPPLQLPTVSGGAGSASSQGASANGTSPDLQSDYDKCMAMWGPKTKGGLITRQDWETSCRRSAGK